MALPAFNTPDLARYVLDNLTTAVIVLDSELNVAYVNPAGEALFSASTRQLVGVPVDALVREADVVEQLRRALADRQAYTERERTVAFGTGEARTVDCVVTPLEEPALGTALLLEFHDLDRLMRISREERLLSQNRITQALVRSLAHEVKNPLGGLRGAAQLLERELGDPALVEYTQVVMEEADRLQNLVDRMLGPNDLPQRRWVNIHQVLERVLSLVKAEAPAGVTIHRDYDPSIPELWADADQLIQAVLNVVRNAVQAVGERGDVTLRTRPLRRFTIGQISHRLVIRLDVIDNGPGIPPALLERLFYPMVSGREGGSGLGLSIAQSLVNRHDGLIECESEPGRTVFSFFLPLEPPNNEHA